MFMTTALSCLAAAIYFEARGEPIIGQIAVAQVVLNRVEDWRWPDTVCDVVKENRHPGTLHRCQFSFYCDGLPEIVTDQAAWNTAEHIAGLMLDGTYTLTVPATHYHAVQVAPFWSLHYTFLGRVGDHLFYYSPDPLGGGDN
jgi:spore germination cell wall hydrolase CwlJ-like protein